MQKGNIGVTTENIFPVIKKFLYSDHEIFLREMVSKRLLLLRASSSRSWATLLYALTLMPIKAPSPSATMVSA